MVILVPVLSPTIEAPEIAPVHFGIIVVVNIQIGLVTPPTGLNLYAASAITGIPVHIVLRVTLPWIPIIVFVFMVVTYGP